MPPSLTDLTTLGYVCWFLVCLSQWRAPRTVPSAHWALRPSFLNASVAYSVDGKTKKVAGNWRYGLRKA